MFLHNKNGLQSFNAKVNSSAHPSSIIHLDTNSTCRCRPWLDFLQNGENLLSLTSTAGYNSWHILSWFFSFSSQPPEFTTNHADNHRFVYGSFFRTCLSCWRSTCGDEVIVSWTRLQRPSGHLDVRVFWCWQTGVTDWTTEWGPFGRTCNQYQGRRRAEQSLLIKLAQFGYFIIIKETRLRFIKVLF